MSGIFGLIGPTPAVEQLSARMGRSMVHRPWYVVERFVDRERPVAIGRIGINVFNRAKQPLKDESGSIMVFLAGELRSAEGIDQHCDEAAVLHAYQAYGLEFPRYVTGAFVTAVVDRVKQRVVIANDRFGLYPTYYAHVGEWFAFAPELKALLLLPTVPKDLDKIALAQYMRLQQLLGTRTFFSAISALAPASVLSVDLESCVATHTRYWSFDTIPYRPDISFGDAADHTAHLLGSAVRRMSGDGYRPGVFLSGGLDSRTLLGSVVKRPVVSLTFGHPDSRDVRYAARIASVVGSDHHCFPLLDGRWVLPIVDEHLDLTEGFHSWIHAHGMSMLPAARELMDVNLTGWDGGTVMGHPGDLEVRQTRPVDDQALVARLFDVYTQEITWPSLTEAEERLLYTPAWRSCLLGAAFESFRDELSRYTSCRREARGQMFSVGNHVGRSTIHMVTFARSHIEVRCPFFDYSLIDFVFSLPNENRNRKLVRAVLRRLAPRLARIPYDADEVLPLEGSRLRSAHEAWVKVKRRVNRHIAPVFSNWATLYADYEGYLRKDLRQWAESILLDRRTLDRGIFEPDFVRSLWSRHQTGRELHTIGKIAPIITYELMLRRLVDQSRSADPGG